MFITKRVQAALQGFRNPSSQTKSFSGYGLDDDGYGRAPGLTARNHDLSFTEAGAATAFGVVVEVQRGVMFIADSIKMLPAGIYDSRTDELLISLDTRQLNINIPGATFVRAVREYERRWLHNFFDSIAFSDWLYGETFTVRLTNTAGGVAGLRWLNPLFTQPQRMRGRIDRYDYSGDDGYVTITPEQMAFRIHHRNPYDDLRGISPVLSALASMNIERNAERGIISYFRNGMILGGVMMPENENTMLSGPQLSKIKQDMKQHHEGTDNAWRWVLAPTRMSFQSFDQPDLQKNYEVVKDASKKIMMALGVPPELAGNPDSVSYDNADKIMTNWLKVNGKAYASSVESFINTSLLPYFEPNAPVYFKFDFTQVDRQDAALTQADFNAGIIPINVAQAQRGYEVDEDLDDIYIIGGKPVHKNVIIQVSRDPVAFGAVTPTPLMLSMPGQPLPGLPSGPVIPALPAGEQDLPEPQKGAASLCVMLSLANNPDLIDLQKRLKVMYPDPAVRWLEPADFHVTMLYVPAIEDTQIDELVSILPETSADGLSLKVGSLACFDNVGEHALHFRVARNSSLLDAQASLYDTAETMGLQTSGYSRPAQYTPHITMGYLPEKIGRMTFHGKVSVQPSGVICSVERGGEDEVVYPVEEEPRPEPEKALTLQHGDHSHDLRIIRRDYSPEAALSELKAWQTFVARGKSSRPFVFKMLKGDPADYIGAQLAAGATPGEIVKALRARFDGSELRSLTSQFERVFDLALSEDVEAAIKSISEIESGFAGRFTPVIESMREGTITSRQRAGNILRQLIRMYGAQAYREGMKDGGVDEDPTEDEQAEINKLISEQSSYVSNLTSRVLANDGKNDIPMAGNADTWFRKSIMPFYYAGRIAAKANVLMEMVGEDGDESCDTCQRLKGQRHRLKDWNKKQLIPQIHTKNYECGGWKCNHGLEEATGKARGSW